MQREEVEAVGEIRKLIFKFIKYYKGKGPQYVNVNFDDNNINIYIKGIFTNMEKLLFEHCGEEEIKTVFKDVMVIIKMELIKEINEALQIKCIILSVKQNYIDDSITIIFRIIN